MVCTAGINEKGEWRRIYPIPFRELSELEKYKKYQWVKVEIIKNTTDLRPESFKLYNQHIEIVSDNIDTKNNWQDRKDILFRNIKVYNDLTNIIDKAHSNEISLCIFKPTKILNFVIEDAEREWNSDVLEQIKRENKQEWLFPELKKEIKLVRKLPYKFFL